MSSEAKLCMTFIGRVGALHLETNACASQVYHNISVQYHLIKWN